LRGDQVFGERFCATTDGITSTDVSFPDGDFFPNISALYIDDMTDDAGANANANLNANPPAAPYVGGMTPGRVKRLGRYKDCGCFMPDCQ
jgi:hypothetical protein